jgi:ABC-type multidrug transport system fused ATPase/permease subunit
MKSIVVCVPQFAPTSPLIPTPKSGQFSHWFVYRSVKDVKMSDMQGKRQRSLWVVTKRLWGHLGPHRRLYVIGLLLGVVDAVCQVCVPMFFREVLNQLQVSSAGFMEHWFWPTLIAGVVLTVVFFPAAFFFHVLVSVAVTRLMRDLRTSLYQHVQNLSADFFHRRKIGEINQRLNNDIDTVSSAGYTMMGIVWHVGCLLFAMAMMFWIDWRLASLFLVLMLAVTVWSNQWLPKIRSMNRSVRDAVGEVSATITEFIGLNELIKSYTREDFAEARIHHHSNIVRKKTEHLIWQQNIFGDIMQVLMRFMAPLLLLFVGTWLLTRSYMRIGDLVAFWGFWLLMGGAITGIIQMFTNIFAGLASADRVFDFFDERPLVEDKPSSIALAEVRGEVAFEDVVFRYPTESDAVVLDHVSFTVPVGRRIAIVGPSGAGKSTILQLIMRFYDPAAGRVAIDGHDLRGLTQASLRANVGMVMQDSMFFAGTIEANLRLANEDATSVQMLQALQYANALEFVNAMPNGLRTMIGERGTRLSGGQKQRLSIARVFLKNPPILLFDEATSALDSMAERQVQAAMEKLMKGRTTIIVAHRISTIQSADEILVIQKGVITGRGSHDQLLETSALYRELCRHQHLRQRISTDSQVAQD